MGWFEFDSHLCPFNSCVTLNKFLHLSVQPAHTMGKGQKQQVQKQRSSVCSSTSKVFCLVGDGFFVCMCVHVCVCAQGR